MTQPTSRSDRFKALIVGGGVAALEAALALRELAGDAVETTVLAPNSEFVYRPLSVREPFARSAAARFALGPLLADAGAEHKVGALRWLDHSIRLVHDDAGRALPYDGLLLAVGAHPWKRYPRAITLDPDRLDDQLHGIVQDIEAGTVKSLAFVIPPGRSWPLPAYELALMTAARAYAMGQAPRIMLLTPEPAPLDIFGAAASEVVATLLADAGIELFTSATADIRVAGEIYLTGQSAPFHADSIVALPELIGPGIPGIPASASHGFVATDPHGRVRHLDRVFAAGDMTDYPVKQGAIAAQQGLCVAQELSGLAGVAGLAEPFEPVIHGVLLGPSQPLYLRARLVEGRPVSSEVSHTPLWAAGDKIHAPYLTRALAAQAEPLPSVASLARV